MTHDDTAGPAPPVVVVGPWRGSNRFGIAPGKPVERKPIPNRYRDQWGRRQLMDCAKCRTPFAPDAPVPPKRVCAECRAEDAYLNPVLPLDEET